MRAIFISYRRDDAEGHAGRLFEDLAERFGKASVFMDVTGIEPGRDFRRVIEQQVASCGVLLAVIGKGWLTASDAQGKRRLDDPADFVRLETASALKRDIPVIPVLVHGAVMPRPEQLPEALTDLAYRNSVELNHARWSSDVQLLIDALLPYVDAAAPAPGSSAPPTATASAGGRRLSGAALGALGAAFAVVLAGVGYVVGDRGDAAAPGGAASVPASGVVATPKPESTIAEGPTKEATSTPAVASAPGAVERSQVAAAPESRAAPPGSVASAPAEAGKKVATVPARGIEAPRVKTEVRKPAAKPEVPVALVEKPPAGAFERAPAVAASPAAALPPVLPVPAAPLAAAPVPAAVEAAAAARVESPRANAGLALLGDPASPSAAGRTIVITPQTRYVNVTGGEIVRFTVGDNAFAWNFSGRPSSFDLALVAPPGMLDHKVIAYIAPNPLYRRPGR